MKRIGRKLRAGGRHVGVLVSSLSRRDARAQLSRLIDLLRRVVVEYERGGLPALGAAIEPEADARLDSESAEQALAQIDALTAITLASRFRTCLRRAALRYHVLRAAGQPVALVIGARRTQEAAGLEGHAWVEVQGQAFRDDDELIAAMTVMYRHPAVSTGV